MLFFLLITKLLACLEEKKKKVALLKVNELSNVAKGLRAPNPTLKLLVSALCILFDQTNGYTVKENIVSVSKKAKDAREQAQPDGKQVNV